MFVVGRWFGSSPINLPLFIMEKRLSETEYQLLKKKIEREWPIRCKLAELAGHKANPKNIAALVGSEFDLNIRDLYLEVLFRKPDNSEAALKVIQECYK